MELDQNGSEKQEVNLQAQHLRHNRVFLKKIFFYRTFFRWVLDIKSFFKRGTSPKVHLDEPMIIKNPFKKFLRQTLALGGALLITTSVAPQSIRAVGFTADYFEEATDFIQEGDTLAEDVAPFVMDKEGVIQNTSPATEEVSRIGFTDSVKHTVVPGDALSSIAVMYGIHLPTLLWENGLSEYSTLKVGQVLIVPSVDGVSYTVADKDTIASIAKKYTVEEKIIREHNKLAEADTITKGQKLFIPGGKPAQPVIVVRAGTRSGARSVDTFDPKVVIASSDAPSGGKLCIFPINGKVTQGFKAGHYAVDIANSLRVDIWAACGGKVVRVHNGCPAREVRMDRSCGGGYGNFVEIESDNGLKILYAHFEKLYVKEGDDVTRGQALGKEGNSGRTFGATGNHLHAECTMSGSRQNCLKFF